MFVHDPESLRFVDVNRAATSLYGYTRDEFLDMLVTNIRVGSEEELWRRLGNLPKGAQELYSSTHRKRDGKLIDVHVAIAPIRWRGIDAIFAVVEDVTEHVRTRSTLSRVLTFAKTGVFEWEIATNKLSCTDEVYKIFGHEPQASIGFAEFVLQIHAQDRTRFETALTGALASGEPYEIECRIIRPDGSERIILGFAVPELDEQTKPIRVTGIVTDVSDRRALEDELRRRSEALARAQQIARLGSWDLDLVTGRCEWSPELYEIYGMNPGIDVPQPDKLWKHDHPDDTDRVRILIAQARTLRVPYKLDHRIIRRDGKTRWVQEQGQYSYDDAGLPMRFVGTVLEITDENMQKSASSTWPSTIGLQVCPITRCFRIDCVEPFIRVNALDEWLRSPI